MPPPIPRCSSWAYSSLNSPSHFSLPRYGSRVGPHIVLFEACSTFTRVAACTLALSPIRDTLIEGFSHFVTSMTAPIASGWSGCRVGLPPTGKRRLSTAHTLSRRQLNRNGGRRSRGASQPTIAISLVQQSRLVLSKANRRRRLPIREPAGVEGGTLGISCCEERVALALKRIEQNYAPTQAAMLSKFPITFQSA